MKLAQFNLVFALLLINVINKSNGNSDEAYKYQTNVILYDDLGQIKIEQKIFENNSKYDQQTQIEGEEHQNPDGQSGGEQESEQHHKKYTPDDTQYYVFIAMAIVLVIFAGICSGLTVGYLGLTNLELEIKLRNGSEDEKQAARSIKPLIQNHHKLLSTLLLSNAIAMEALPIFLDSVFPAWAAVLISTVAVVIVGEIIPQAYCTGKYQLKIGKFFAPLCNFLMKALCIFTVPVSLLLDCMLGVHDNSRLEKKEDMVGYVELQKINDHQPHSSNAEHQKGLTDDEIKLVTSTMSLREKNVTDHMVKYPEIYKLSENELINQKLLIKIANKGYSNIVVHEDGNQSKVVGILKAKQLITQVDEETNAPIKDIIKLQEPILISDKTNMLELMMIFQKKKTTVALVFVSQKKEVNENTSNNLQDIQLSEKLANPKTFKGIFLGLVSLKDVFEVMINKDLHDEDSHQQDPYYKMIKTLGPSNPIKKSQTNSNVFSSIRKKY